MRNFCVTLRGFEWKKFSKQKIALPGYMRFWLYKVGKRAISLFCLFLVNITQFSSSGIQGHAVNSLILFFFGKMQGTLPDQKGLVVSAEPLNPWQSSLPPKHQVSKGFGSPISLALAACKTCCPSESIKLTNDESFVCFCAFVLGGSLYVSIGGLLMLG